jgi:hypothetical protein
MYVYIYMYIVHVCALRGPTNKMWRLEMVRSGRSPALSATWVNTRMVLALFPAPAVSICMRIRIRWLWGRIQGHSACANKATLV